MNKNIYKAVLAFVVALTVILSGAAMGASFDFRENEQISSSDVDIIENLQTLDDENPPMPLTVIELLNEDFTVAVPPAGWTESQLGEWYQCSLDWDPPTGMAGGLQPEAAMDYTTPIDDYAYLQTVPVDSTVTSTLTLEFKSMIMDYSAIPTYSCYVKVRADSGDTWTDVTPWSNPISADIGEFCNATQNTHTIDISSDIGTATQVMFEFVGEDYDINFWFLDDVKLYGEEIPRRTPVSIQPDTQMVEKGETFTVSVFVEPTEPIIGVTMGVLSFDPTLIQANSVTEGDLFGTSLMWDPGLIDNTAGTITDAYVLALSANAVSDPGNFAIIEFTAQDTFGTSELDLEGMIVASVASGELLLNVTDGEVIITEMFDLTIDVVGSGTTNPAEGINTFAYGTLVDLEAFEGSCYEFAGWSGPDAGEIVGDQINMTKDMEITATFDEIFYDLTINVVGDGTTDPIPGIHTFACGTVVPVEAITDPGWEFSDWSGDLVSINPSDSILMDGDKTITATFTQIFHELTILLDGSGTTTPAAGVHSYVWGDVVPVQAFADTNWAFTEWTGDLVSANNPDSILMDADKTITAVFKQGWTATLNLEASISSNNIDWVVFGESAIASDGIDAFDLPKPDAPPAPYLYAHLATDLAEPYNILWNDFRFYPADEQVWDLFVETQGTGDYTTTTMTWDTAEIILSGYDYVGLYEMISGNLVADMKDVGTYVYLSDHGMSQHYQIRCSNNHAPVANDDSYTTNENTQLTVTAPGVLVNDNDPEGDPISVTGVISGPSDGIVDIFADGHFIYTPDVGFVGTDSFVYEITDGLLTDTATVTIDVIPLNRISIKERWNLISLPVGEDIDRDDIIVEHLGVRHSWQEAISLHLVLGGFTYGWQAGMYNNEALLEPGEGYWLWSYVDCDLLIPSSVPGDNHVTILDVEWNLVGVPSESDVSKTSLRVQFEGIWRYWDTAVGMGVILDFVYNWDRDDQFYTISDDPDTFVSGFGYWVYAYEGCALKQLI